MTAIRVDIPTEELVVGMKESVGIGGIHIYCRGFNTTMTLVSILWPLRDLIRKLVVSTTDSLWIETSCRDSLSHWPLGQLHWSTELLWRL